MLFIACKCVMGCMMALKVAGLYGIALTLIGYQLRKRNGACKPGIHVTM